MSEPCRRARGAALAGRARAESLISGEYPVRAQGLGLEYVGLREYAPGDDFRRIDWKASARVGLGLERLFVREYSAERRVRLVYLVDLTASMRFKGKLEALLYVLALHARISEALRDEVALVVLSDSVQRWGFSRPTAAVERVLERVCRGEVGGSLDLGEALEALAAYARGLPLAVYTDYANSAEGFARVHAFSRASGGRARFYVLATPGEKGSVSAPWSLPLFEEESSARGLGPLEELASGARRHIALLRGRLPPRSLIEVPALGGPPRLRVLVLSYLELRRKA